MHAYCSSLKQCNWASQVHFYSAHSPAITASVATGTFPIQLHKIHCKAHSQWPAKAARVKCLSLQMSKVFIILRVHAQPSEGSGVQGNFQHIGYYCIVENIATNVTCIIYWCTCRHRVTVVTVLTDGGPYVSADDVPELGEIHPSDSSGGD